MVNIHNYEGQLKRMIERINESKEISTHNKKLIAKFRNQLNIENIGHAKTIRYLADVIKFNKMYKKPFDKATKQDLKEVIGKLNDQRKKNGDLLSEETKRSFKIMLRRLYRCLRDIDEKEVYPEEVSWMQVDQKGNGKKLPEILTEDEVKKVIKHCRNIRDKALISTIATSGCRVSEIGTLKIKNVSFKSHGSYLTVDGKTGMRKILVVDCTPYLQEWVNQHPDNQNPNAYLWPAPNKEPLSYARIATILKQAAKDAKIEKRVHLHLLRHTRATYLSSFMSDSQLKTYMGWTSSSMIGIYTHLSGKDTDDAILAASGIKIPKSKAKMVMKPKKCLRCHTVNEATNKCCKQCGLILDQKYAEEVLQENDERVMADKLMNKLMEDPDILKLIKEKLNQ